MIRDLDALEGRRVLGADVCIVGAGAAGIAAALELVGSGFRVLVLEAGGERSAAAPGAEVDGPARPTFAGSRARGLGGTTALWAGQLLPLDAVDFEARDWVPSSGWPFASGTLDPYVRRAEALFGVAARGYDLGSWPARSPRPPLPDDGSVQFRYSQFAPDPDLGRRYRTRLAAAPSVTVMLHAEVTEIVVDDAGAAVREVRVRTPSGPLATVVATHYVLCCGGVDTARLLLASGGLGDGHDLVGRCFQEHAHVKVPVAPAHPARWAAMFNTRRVAGGRLYPKLVASPDLQRRERILNVGADICYAADEASTVESAKRVVRAVRHREPTRDLGPSLARMARHPGELLAAGYRAGVRTHKASEVGPPFLCIQCESAPEPTNRVQLAGGSDASGIPRAALTWRLGPLERRTIEVFAGVLAEHVARAGLGRLDLSGLPLPPDGPELDAAVDVGFHHMGATRMHEDPRLGVVAPDCRVHGLDNLWVASSSVFPTGGYSNPTLTIVALAIRLADTLKAESR